MNNTCEAHSVPNNCYFKKQNQKWREKYKSDTFYGIHVFIANSCPKNYFEERLSIRIN